MNRWIKIGGIGALLAGASFFFGKVCERFDGAFPLLLSPSRDLLDLLLWFLIAVGAVLISVELAAALVRPLWLGLGLFAVSALGMLLSCAISPISLLLSLVYVSGAALYYRRATAELENRIAFSVGALAEKQGILLAVLIFIASAHLYLGVVQHLRRESLSIPQGFVEMYGGWIEGQIMEQIPPEEREQARAEFHREFQSQMEGMFDSLVGRFEPWIPLALALGVFMTLQTALGFLSWIPGLILSLVFALLSALKFTTEVAETREVRRITL
jgi:hypothetical protein